MQQFNVIDLVTAHAMRHYKIYVIQLFALPVAMSVIKHTSSALNNKILVICFATLRGAVGAMIYQLKQNKINYLIIKQFRLPTYIIDTPNLKLYKLALRSASLWAYSRPRQSSLQINITGLPSTGFFASQNSSEQI